LLFQLHTPSTFTSFGIDNKSLYHLVIIHYGASRVVQAGKTRLCLSPHNKSSLILWTQTPLEKAHAARAAKKSKREENKVRRMAALKKAREKKAAAK